MKKIKKISFPPHRARQFLEPGPIVLVTSHAQGQDNIMTLGWHTVLEFSPSLVGCMITAGNHSHAMIRDSGECVINLPTSALVDTVVRIGNCTGEDTDKFTAFGLTRAKAKKVEAPWIAECHAHLECRLHDDILVESYNFFIFEIISAHAATSPRNPETLHYRGDGLFNLSGKTISRRRLFDPALLASQA